MILKRLIIPDFRGYDHRDQSEPPPVVAGQKVSSLGQKFLNVNLTDYHDFLFHLTGHNDVFAVV